MSHLSHLSHMYCNAPRVRAHTNALYFLYPQPRARYFIISLFAIGGGM